MGLIVGIARWRHHHAVPPTEEGLTAAEMATVLKVALPLVRVTGHQDACLQFRVLTGANANAAELVWAELENDGTVQSCVEAPADPTAWGRGEVGNWISILLDRELDAVQIAGEQDLVSDLLIRLHDVLWNPQPF
jgi:hypothetical protein